jgi:hypothetical protein
MKCKILSVLVLHIGWNVHNKSERDMKHRQLVRQVEALHVPRRDHPNSRWQAVTTIDLPEWRSVLGSLIFPFTSEGEAIRTSEA